VQVKQLQIHPGDVNMVMRPLEILRRTWMTSCVNALDVWIQASRKEPIVEIDSSARQLLTAVKVVFEV